MKRNRRKSIIIISIVSLVAVLCGTIAVASLTGSSAATLGQQEPEKDGDVKYEKPAVGDIAQDGAYPDEKKSDSSPNGQEKQWYEYVTYSKIPIYEIKAGNQKLVFYDPYDYNYGLVMELSNPSNEFGDYYDGEEGYTTANEISVTYSVSSTTTWNHAWSVELGFEESGGVEIPLLAKGEMKFTQTFGYNGSWTNSDDSSASKTVTYNALYFNSNGTPYRWRIVKYTVYLPLYCECQIFKNGEWIVVETNYCLLTTVEGTCREWINEVAYVEDWRTGEPMQVENFWKEYYSTYDLLDAYINQLIPQN